jgi:hypothetical protein
MGLLDDAIREHLELKRRRGADPGEVAREEREALDDPLHPGAGRDVDPSSVGSGATPQLAADAPASNVLEETAELDMQSVLDQRADSANMEDSSDGSTGAGPPEDPVPETAAGEGPLKWEVPGEGTPGRVGEAVGPAADLRETLSVESAEQLHPAAEDLVADVTDGPRDASEQDRLWRDSNAPRDVNPDE